MATCRDITYGLLRRGNREGRDLSVFVKSRPARALPPLPECHGTCLPHTQINKCNCLSNFSIAVIREHGKGSYRSVYWELAVQSMTIVAGTMAGRRGPEAASENIHLHSSAPA